MLLVLKPNSEELGREAARVVANAIRRNPCLRVGLATGSTMLGMYRELVRLHREERLDFSRVVTFNLDEYLGLSGNHPQSLRHFMQQNFFGQVNVAPGNIHIPDGSIKGDYQQYCASYEEAIREAGGIDLQNSRHWPQRPRRIQRTDFQPGLANPFESSEQGDHRRQPELLCR